jgi:hypothetical protein
MIRVLGVPHIALGLCCFLSWFKPVPTKNAMIQVC